MPSLTMPVYNESRLNLARGRPHKQPGLRRNSAPEAVVDLACPLLVDAYTGHHERLLRGDKRSGNPELVWMLTGRVFCSQCGGRVVSWVDGKRSCVNMFSKTLYPHGKRVADDTRELLGEIKAGGFTSGTHPRPLGDEKCFNFVVHRAD